jgi:RNA polymerase sigma factor for flagellar operon FliA
VIVAVPIAIDPEALVMGSDVLGIGAEVLGIGTKTLGIGADASNRVRGAEAQQAMVLRHTGLVRQIAQHMRRRMPDNIDLDDLIQTGMVGLLEAVQRYEGRKGSSFVTYAMRRIRGAILDAARRSDWSPRSLRRRLRDIEGAKRRLELQTGAAPTAAAIAEAVGITLDQYYRALRDFTASVQLSLDEPLPAEGGRAAWAEPADDHPGPAEAFEREEVLHAMTAAIDALPDHERAILLLYYGEEYLMREIGASLDVSESRICQIHKRTIERLRAATLG